MWDKIKGEVFERVILRDKNNVLIVDEANCKLTNNPTDNLISVWLQENGKIVCRSFNLDHLLEITTIFYDTMSVNFTGLN